MTGGARPRWSRGDQLSAALWAYPQNRIYSAREYQSARRKRSTGLSKPPQSRSSSRSRGCLRLMPAQPPKRSSAKIKIPCLRHRERGGAVGNMPRRAVVRLHLEIRGGSPRTPRSPRCPRLAPALSAARRTETRQAPTQPGSLSLFPSSLSTRPIVGGLVVLTPTSTTGRSVTPPTSRQTTYQARATPATRGRTLVVIS
jgi:hypothetical protein